MKRTIVLFTRVPDPSDTKTRLRSFLTAEQCAALQWAMLGDVLDQCRASGYGAVVSYTPPERAARLGPYLRGEEIFPQRGAGLGERMYGAFVRVLRDGGAAVLIGSDLPYLTAPVFSRAFALLEDHDVVMGPSADGGYYLIGMKAPRRELFDVNGYGGATVLGQTLAAARRAGLSAALCPVGRDVDDKEDLLELAAAVERGETACPRTARFLRGIGLARGARP